MTPIPSNWTLQAELQPLQGRRFRPTSFPNLGASEFFGPDGQLSLLLESSQSVANRLEAVTWDPLTLDLVPPLQGMPYVRLQHPKHGLLTSLTEAHRIGSAYLFPQLETLYFKDAPKPAPGPLYHAATLLRIDPCSLLHGVFLWMVKPSLRFTRLLTGFIEADGASTVDTGGVKFDRADPSGPSGQGKGDVPYALAEYTARSITAYFHFDGGLLQSYGLPSEAQSFLFDLSLYKVRRFLDTGLRLRSSCALKLVDTSQPLPSTDELEARLQQGISQLKAGRAFGEVVTLNPA